MAAPELISVTTDALKPVPFKSDALVLFGATGDLAFKKIFPALFALAKRGDLNIPIVGVAFSNWDQTQLRTRVLNSIHKYVFLIKKIVLTRRCWTI